MDLSSAHAMRLRQLHVVSTTRRAHLSLLVFASGHLANNLILPRPPSTGAAGGVRRGGYLHGTCHLLLGRCGGYGCIRHNGGHLRSPLRVLQPFVRRTKGCKALPSLALMHLYHTRMRRCAQLHEFRNSLSLTLAT